MAKKKNKYNKFSGGGNTFNVSGAISNLGSLGINTYQLAQTSSNANDEIQPLWAATDTYLNSPVEQSSREALMNQQMNNAGPGLGVEKTGDDFRASNADRAKSVLSNVGSGAALGSTIGSFAGPIGTAIGGAVGALGGAAVSVFGINKSNKKAALEANRYNAARIALGQSLRDKQDDYKGAAQNMDEVDTMNFLRNYSAYGGSINRFPMGGYLGHTHGSMFDNGVQYINNGGSHEANPYDGVMIGVDNEGVPNLAEEGEVIYNNYVFSDRLAPTEEELIQFGLPKKYKNKTFAKIAKSMSKESEERPNDPISKRSFNTRIGKLTNLHELVRQREEAMQQQLMAFGGRLFPNGGFADMMTSVNYSDSQKLKRQMEEAAAQNRLNLNALPEDYQLKYGSIYKPYNYVDGYNSNWFDDDGNYINDYLVKVDQSDKDFVNQAFKNQYNYWSDLSHKGDARWRAVDEFYKTNPEFKTDNINLTDDQYQAAKYLAADGKAGFMHMLFADEFDKELNPSIKTDSLDYADRNIQKPIGNILDKSELPNERVSVPELPDIPVEEIADEPIYIDPEDQKDVQLNNETPSVPRIEPEEPNGYNFADIFSTLGRYAPIVGSLAALANNKKDYSDVNSYMAQTANPRSVRYTPIGNYISPDYISPYALTAPITRQINATNNAIRNNAGNNRAAANAYMVANDYNGTNQMGVAQLQGRQYNNQQKVQAAQFNRGTDMFNSQGSLQAQAQNMSLNNYYLNRALQQYNMKNQIDTAYNQARSANLTNFTQGLADLGREAYIMNQLKSNRALMGYMPTSWGSSKYKG